MLWSLGELCAKVASREEGEKVRRVRVLKLEEELGGAGSGSKLQYRLVS
jgi:hypothetical protein